MNERRETPALLASGQIDRSRQNGRIAAQLADLHHPLAELARRECAVLSIEVMSDVVRVVVDRPPEGLLGELVKANAPTRSAQWIVRADFQGVILFWETDQ